MLALRLHAPFCQDMRLTLLPKELEVQLTFGKNRSFLCRMYPVIQGNTHYTPAATPSHAQSHPSCFSENQRVSVLCGASLTLSVMATEEYSGQKVCHDGPGG